MFVQDYHFSLLGRMLAEARPDLRTVHFLHTPFAAPDMLAVLPDDVVAELLDGMAGYSAPAASTATSGRPASPACYAAAGRPAPPTFVAPLGPDADVLEEEAASPAVRGGGATRCGPRWAGAASSPGATAWSRRRTSCGGCSPSRSC